MIQLLQGDCLELMQAMPDKSVDLVVTSPPYADRRKNTYGGIPPNLYVDWFTPHAIELMRLTRPRGTFILNIKEQVQNGERHTYVIELILEMRKIGWLWTEEFIWHKTTSMPGKWPNRFRDSWERLLQFNKQKEFAMYQDSVMVQTSESTKSRVKKLSQKDKTRQEMQTNSGFGINHSHSVGRDMVYPDNVLLMSPETKNVGHSAAFPLSLPKWFISLFTKSGDVVLDPFLGSGTTGAACVEMRRDFIGIERNPKFFTLAQKRIEDAQSQGRFDLG